MLKMKDFVALMGHTFGDFHNTNFTYLAANKLKNNKKFGVDGTDNDLANSPNKDLKELVQDLSGLYKLERILHEHTQTSQEYRILENIIEKKYSKILDKINQVETLDYKVKSE